MAYLARYAPGAPTPWVLSLTAGDLRMLLEAVSSIVEREKRTNG